MSHNASKSGHKEARESSLVHKITGSLKRGSSGKTRLDVPSSPNAPTKSAPHSPLRTLLVDVSQIVVKFGDLNRAILDFCDATAASIFRSISSTSLDSTSPLPAEVATSSENFIFFTLLSTLSSLVCNEILNVEADPQSSLDGRVILREMTQETVERSDPAWEPERFLEQCIAALEENLGMLSNTSESVTPCVPPDFIDGLRHLVTLATEWKGVVDGGALDWQLEPYLAGRGSFWDPETMVLFEHPEDRPTPSPETRIHAAASIGLATSSLLRAPDEGERRPPAREKCRVILESDYAVLRLDANLRRSLSRACLPRKAVAPILVTPNQGINHFLNTNEISADQSIFLHLSTCRTSENR